MNVSRILKAYERAQQEVDELLGQGPIMVDHLSKLKYINAILRETLRLHSPLTSLNFTPVEDTVIGGKSAVEKGEAIALVLRQLHADPKVYGDDALAWKPERMLDEPFNALPPSSWKPLGNGIRACIGRPFAWQEGLLIMAMLLQNVNFCFEDPSCTLALRQAGTIKPKDFHRKAVMQHGYSTTKLQQAFQNGNDNGKATDMHAEAKPTRKVAESGMKGKPMTLFCGSNTGTCEPFTNRLASSASSHGFQCIVAFVGFSKREPEERPTERDHDRQLRG